MSTAPYMQLVSEVLPVQRRDFYMADATLLNPNNANPILDGEWLQLDSAYKLTRGGAGNVGVVSWQVFAERGRYDTQSIGKVPVLFTGGYEAETTICNTAGLAVGDALIVSDVTVGGQTKKGLIKLPATAATVFLVRAYVTRLLGGGKIRYWNPGAPVSVTNPA